MSKYNDDEFRKVWENHIGVKDIETINKMLSEVKEDTIKRTIEETIKEVNRLIDLINSGYNICEKSKLKAKIKKEFKH